MIISSFAHEMEGWGGGGATGVTRPFRRSFGEACFRPGSATKSFSHTPKPRQLKTGLFNVFRATLLK